LSKESREEARVVSLNELIARANQLRDYITILGSQIETYRTHISELQIVLNTLNNLPAEGSSALMVLDRLNTAFIPVNIGGGWSSSVIINIGRNYYIKTDKARAVEIIEKRLDNLGKILNNLNQQYQALLNEYNYIQQILLSIYAEIEKKRGGESG